jgi:hypothetical protein
MRKRENLTICQTLDVKIEDNYPIITYPLKPSEFDVQADLYCDLRNLGYDCKNQVSAFCGEKKSIFDIVIFDSEKRPRIIIEAKDTNHKQLLFGKPTLQIETYQKYQLPILVYTPYISKEVIVEKVKTIMDKPFGCTLTKKEKRVANMKVVY